MQQNNTNQTITQDMLDNYSNLTVEFGDDGTGQTNGMPVNNSQSSFSPPSTEAKADGMSVDESQLASVSKKSSEKKSKKKKQKKQGGVRSSSKSLSRGSLVKKRKFGAAPLEGPNLVEMDSVHSTNNVRAGSLVIERDEVLPSDDSGFIMDYSESESEEEDGGFFIDMDEDDTRLSHADGLFLVLKHLHIEDMFNRIAQLTPSDRMQLAQVITKMSNVSLGNYREGLEKEYPHGAPFAAISVRLGGDKKGSVKSYMKFYNLVTNNIGKLKFVRGEFLHNDTVVLRLYRHNNQCVAGCYEVVNEDILSRMCKTRFSGEFNPKMYFHYMVYRLNGHITYVSNHFEFTLYELPIGKKKEVLPVFETPGCVARLRKQLAMKFQKPRAEQSIEGFMSSGNAQVVEYAKLVDEALRDYYSWVYDNDALRKRYKDIVAVLNAFIGSNKAWRARVQGKIGHCNWLKVPEFDYFNAGLSCYPRRTRKTFGGEYSIRPQAKDGGTVYNWSGYSPNQVQIEDFKAIIIQWTDKKNVLLDWASLIVDTGFCVAVTYDQAHATSIKIVKMEGQAHTVRTLCGKLLGQACRIYRGEVEYMIQHVRGWFSLNDSNMHDIGPFDGFDVDIKDVDDDLDIEF
jgi:hypothetical protein